eukprot:scaffold4127_cov36-Phaeocystis_antarctica.AAC.2
MKCLSAAELGPRPKRADDWDTVSSGSDDAFSMQRRRCRPSTCPKLQLLCRYARAASPRAASNLLMKRVTVSEKECSFVLDE